MSIEFLAASKCPSPLVLLWPVLLLLLPVLLADDVGRTVVSFGLVVVEEEEDAFGIGLELWERLRNGLFPPTVVMRLKIENAVFVTTGGVGVDDNDVR